MKSEDRGIMPKNGDARTDVKIQPFNKTLTTLKSSFVLYLHRMKVLKNIILLLIGAIFLLSSSGYVLYSSICACTGEKQTSVFLKPETCETNFHQHHEHNLSGKEIACSEEECHECTSHTKACGCESPVVFFFKLEDKATNEKIRFVTLQVLSVNLLNTGSFEPVLLTPEDKDNANNCSDPPPLSYSSLDFLIRIQQLKIPSLA